MVAASKYAPKMEEAMPGRFILSIDGGGIRGIIPAAILVDLEARLKSRKKTKPLHAYFDLIAGTSTGGIIAAGLTCPKPGKPASAAATPKDLLDLYVKEGPDIFNRNFLQKYTNFAGWHEERYSAAPLEQKLIARFGEDTLIESGLTKVMLTGYDIENRKAVFMTNMDSKHAKIKFWQAARATSAAPTYFEPALVEDYGSLAKNTVKSMAIIDGGVFANDPVLAAYTEAAKKGWLKEDDGLTILSIGTGAEHRKIPYNQAKNWGAAGWLLKDFGAPLISVLMQGQSSTASYQANAILNPADTDFKDFSTVVTNENKASLRYFRINGELLSQTHAIKPNDELDDTDDKNLEALQIFASEIIKANTAALDEIADRL
jgi:uncharacterized protein